MDCINPGTNVEWVPDNERVGVYLEPFASSPHPHCCDPEGAPEIDLQGML